MGFGKRLVKKSVRKATPRSIRKITHPVRTAKRAVTPRPVRQVSRAVYTVTNPLGAAENALIGAALGSGRRRSSSKPRRASNRRVTNPGLSVGQQRAIEAQSVQDQLTQLMGVQRARFQKAARVVIPEPQMNFDLASFRKQEWKARRVGSHVWQLAARKAIRAEADGAAQQTVERLRWESSKLHYEQQQRADQQWQALLHGDQAVLTDALVRAFADNSAPVRVVSAHGQTADLELLLPPMTVLPDRQPSITPGGKRSTKAWTKTGLNDAYAELLGAHLLATLRETWAVAPSLQTVRIRGIRLQDGAMQTLLDQTHERFAHNWQDDRLGNHLTGLHGGLQRSGRTQEVLALD